MELKGNIQIVEQGRNVEISDSQTQITVTIAYTISGIDISEGLPDPNAGQLSEDEFITEADDRIDDIVKQIRREVNDFFSRGWGNYESFPDIVQTGNFIGVHADLNSPSPQSLEEAKNLELDLEIHAFYDLPTSDLETVIEKVKDQVFGKKA